MVLKHFAHRFPGSYFTVTMISILLLTTACAPSNFVKPLDHKQHAITGSFGGPVAHIPGVATIPMPFTAVGYGYGLKPYTTVYGTWSTTSALFGVFQVNAGATQRLWQNANQKMGVTVSPSLNFMVDVFEKNNRLYPQLDANYYYTYRSVEKKGKLKTNYCYIGMSNWFELQKTKAHDQQQTNHVIFSPQFGHTFERKKWNYTIEIKLLAPYASNQDIVVDYLSPFGEKGGMGAYFGLTYKL